MQKLQVQLLKKVAVAAGSVAIIGSLLYFGPNLTQNNPEQEETAQAVLAKQEVRAPLPEINDLFVRFNINPTKDTTLVLTSGTEVYIPANSIVNQQNELVTEAVEIRIREIRKAHEIIASGIPMRYYEEGGEEKWMQTVGMFEVRGYANGEEVKIAPDKSIDVGFAAETKEAVDFWYFDEESGNWENQASNTLGMDDPNLAALEEELNNNTPAPPQPIKPVIGDPKKILPPFKIDYKYFPELKEFRELEWEYTGPVADNPRNDPAFFESWSNVVINKGKGNTYKLTFTRPDRTLEVPVRPCFRQESDLAAFNKSMAEYNTKQEAYQEYMARERELEVYRQRQYQFIRQVSIQNFGIYNWDYLIKQENTIPVYANFDFDNQLPEELQKEVIVYLITGEGRTVVSFPQRDWEDFVFIPEMDNKLVAVLPGGRLAVFLQDQFEAEMDNIRNAANQKYEFKMKILPGSVDSTEELEQIIG